MRVTWLCGVLVLAGAVHAGEKETLASLAKGRLDSGTRVHELEKTAAVAARVAAASVTTALTGRYFAEADQFGAMGREDYPSVATRKSYLGSLRKFVREACAGDDGPLAVRARLDVRIFALRVKRANGERVAPAEALKLASEYADAAAKHGDDVGLLSGAVLALEWAGTFEKSDPSKLAARMLELAQKSGAQTGALRMARGRHRLAAAGLRPSGRKRKDVEALEKEVRAIVEAPGADRHLLRLHRDIVTTLRRVGSKVTYVCEERQLLDFHVETPRGGEWEWTKLPAKAAQSLTRSAFDESLVGILALGAVSHAGKQGARMAADMSLSSFRAQLKDARGHKKPRKGRLNRRIGGCWVYTVTGKDKLGRAVMVRGYSWRNKKTGRTYVMTVYSLPETREDRVLDYVLESIRPR